MAAECRRKLWLCVSVLAYAFAQACGVQFSMYSGCTSAVGTWSALKVLSVCVILWQVDKINNQVASRLVSCFTSWRQYDSDRQAMMKGELQRIVETNGLSDNVFEIASKALQD